MYYHFFCMRLYKYRWLVLKSDHWNYFTVSKQWSPIIHLDQCQKLIGHCWPIYGNWGNIYWIVQWCVAFTCRPIAIPFLFKEVWKISSHLFSITVCIIIIFNIVLSIYHYLNLAFLRLLSNIFTLSRMKNIISLSTRKIIENY